MAFAETATAAVLETAIPEQQSIDRAEPVLLPNHFDDLRRSGLSDDAIRAWGCFSVTSANAHLLKPFAKGVIAPGLALPIRPPGAQEPVAFAYKPDQPRVFERANKRRVCKYELARGGLNRIHVPRRVQRLFLGPDGREGRSRLVIVEGQKKAERAAQEEIACIALLGVWNWFQKFGEESVPIEDLSRIDWERYAPEICFDSDVATNPQVRRAERALARWLIEHGARVSIVRLPAAQDGAKVGLDDYLLNHSVAEFESLPRLPAVFEPTLEDAVEALTADSDKAERSRVLGRILVEEGDPSEQYRLFKRAAKLTGINLRSVKSTALVEASKVWTERQQAEPPTRPPSSEEAEAAEERARQEQEATVDAILNRAKNRISLRAQNAVHGQLAYLCSFGDTETLIVTSQGVVSPLSSLSKEYVVAKPSPNGSPITPEGINRVRGGEIVSGVGLYKDIRDYFGRRVIFKHNSVPGVLALWIMASYAYTIFFYFPYIWLTSVGPSHGKSLVAKIFSALAFNSTAPETDPTPATLFRDVDANCRTLVLDEIENLDPERKGELIALLNAGFERGGRVSRCVPAGDSWDIKRFEVYSPKVIAGIKQIPRPLQTRVLRIDMPKKKPSEETEPFEPDRDLGWLTRKRDDLAIFALRNAPKIAALYEGRAELVPRRYGEGKEAVDDRLRDILAPLYAVAAAIDHEADTLLATPDLERFTQKQAGMRSSDGVGDYTFAAHALFNWAESRWGDGQVLITTDEATGLFRDADIEWAVNPAGAKSLLRKLGGENKPKWWNGKTKRGYVFYREELKDLVERHPLSVESPRHAEEKR